MNFITREDLSSSKSIFQITPKSGFKGYLGGDFNPIKSAVQGFRILQKREKFIVSC